MNFSEKLAWLTTSLILVAMLISRQNTPVPIEVVADTAPSQMGRTIAAVETLIAARRYGEALHHLADVTQTQPEQSLSLILSGRIYLQQHRWWLAEDAFNRALTRDMENPVALAGLAEALLQQGRTSAATTVWQRAVAITPELSTGLGRSHLQNLNFTAALAAFTPQPDPQATWYLAVMTAPNDVEMARRYLYSIPVDDAPHLLTQRDYLLQTLAPFDADSPPFAVAQAVGYALIQTEQWSLAINALTIAHEADPQDGETLAFLAHARQQRGLPAADMFEQAVSLSPDSVMVLSLHGKFLRHRGEWRLAARRFGQVVVLDPYNAAAYADIGAIWAEQGRLDKAETWYRMAVQVADDTFPFEQMLARFYLDHHYRLAEAGLPLLTDLAQLRPHDATLLDWLGWAQFLTGDHAAAETTLQQAVSLDPDLVTARYHLGLVLSVNGKPTAAQAEYQRVIDWDTSGELRQRAQTALEKLG